MKREHNYKTTVKWTGNTGYGTSNYKDFERNHTISVAHKPNILASSDPAFRGNKTKYNPEVLMLASLSSCHMLWYLHLCSEDGVIVIDYVDNAIGTMAEIANGSGQFTEVTLNPIITVTNTSMIQKGEELHKEANKFCFIANSVNFIVKHKATFLVKEL